MKSLNFLLFNFCNSRSLPSFDMKRSYSMRNFIQCRTPVAHIPAIITPSLTSSGKQNIQTF